MAYAVARGAVIELLKPVAKKPIPNMVFDNEPNRGSSVFFIRLFYSLCSKWAIFSVLTPQEIMRLISAA
jgi:hypothetical protein